MFKSGLSIAYLGFISILKLRRIENYSWATIYSTCISKARIHFGLKAETFRSACWLQVAHLPTTVLKAFIKRCSWLTHGMI